jgi:hypothetical protein
MVTYSEQQNAGAPYYDPDTNNNIPTNLSSGIILNNDGDESLNPYVPNVLAQSPVAPNGLVFNKNENLSNGFASLSRSINDFNVFNSYIHYAGSNTINQALSSFGVNVLTNDPKRINVYSKLIFSQNRFEIYNRNFRNQQ